MNSDVRRRLKALADDLEGPLGRIPFDRALRGHIDLFEELRREGCSWSQLARALAAVGVRRADGGTISSDHLRGAVSRQMKVNTSAPTGLPLEDGTVRIAAPKEKASSGSRVGETAAPRARKTAPVKPAGVQKPDQPTAVSRSIQDKLSRVAKLRGG
ncbi:hypothetical protein [Bradyrhizobium sp.]|uniref:hypothetical protein n=1 Tax=Bradyrhizobium sp. TaxID=376 RepID=UPI001EC3E752|nr:hypothetical protein [Bradyrhizobium sp.]MBV8919834.1 hypothetical protein [Bradyrhizobium sp.]MBV9980880.1 hypothetical protein [Bradyrhizobium sp.]